MSLVGSLEDLSLLDILQIVNVSRRTGTLRLSHPGHGPVYVYFEGGSVSDIVGDFSEEAFLTFFEAQGLVDPREMAEARTRFGKKPQGVLQRLLETGALNLRLLEQARRMELSRRLKNLTQQTRGEFAFSLADNGEAPDSAILSPFCPLNQPISPQNLLTETLAENALADWAAPKRPARQEAVAAPPPEKDGPSSAAPEGAPEVIEPYEEIFADPAETAPQPSAPAVEDGEPAPAPAKPYHSMSKVTAVLASDESIFTSLLKKRLLRHFSRVEAVGSLAEFEAVCGKLLHQRTPFLSMVDLLMPTRDGAGYLGGLELLEAANARFPEVKIILLSDLTDERILDLARSKGAVSILLKPAFGHLKIDQLEEALETFSQALCAEADRLLPPIEEEVATFFKDLGVEEVSEGYRVRDQLSLLKGLMGELASPHESSEISLLVLRLASEYFERAILFLAKKEEMVGLGGFGETGDREMMMQKVRRLRVPIGAGSVFDRCVEDRVSVRRSRKDFTEVDRDFAEALGTHAPKEIVVIPMVSRGRVVALLYADNAISHEAPPDLSGIEIFMAQAGLAMEKALLERQLLHLRRSIPRQLGGGEE